MGNLISRNELMKKSFVMDGHRVVSYLDIIDAPTAYDVDAVVVQLEEITESYNLGSYNMGIDKAIDIVRKGGKE